MKKAEQYYVAIELLENRRYVEALQLLEELREINPENSFIEFKIGQIKARNNRTLNEAREIFEKLLKGNNKHSSAALLELGKLEVTERNLNKARSHFNKLIKRQDESLAYLELAKLEMKFRNFKEARRLYQTLIDKHNEHEENALFELGKLERLLGNVDEAISCFELVSYKAHHINRNWIELEFAKLDLMIGEFDRGMHRLKKLLSTIVSTEALNEIVKAYIRVENYDLAYQYNCELQRHTYRKININCQLIDSFLRYKIGLPQTDFYENTYFSNQLYNYSKEETIKHIEKHLDEDNEKTVHSLYSENIVINEIYDFVEKKIKNIDPIDNHLNDRYIIRYPKIVGTVLDQLTDTLQVITIPNTKYITTIYPIPAEDGELKIVEEHSKQKVKESQIDKFNRRYMKK